jgi:hypothetical protein
MNVQAVKTLILAVLALGAASLMFALGPCPAESDEPLRPLPSEATRQALPEILALRIGAKYQIVGDVIAGRLSLVQAAALFGALNQLPPESQPSLLDRYASRPRFPAHTDEELLCQQVVQWVSSELADEQDRLEATVARLEAEFKEALGKEETVRLPDPLTLVPVQKLLEQARAELTDRGVIFPRRRRPEDAPSEHRRRERGDRSGKGS